MGKVLKTSFLKRMTTVIGQDTTLMSRERYKPIVAGQEVGREV